MHPGISHGYGEVASVRYNAFNQLVAVNSTDGSTTSFAYDGNGNQVGKTDSAGLTQYVYDLDNRLRGVALPGGGSNAFEYDANGLRTKKMDSTGTRSFLLDGLSVVAEYQGGSRSAFYAQSLARIDEVLSVVNGSGKYWYESDALGSTYALTSRASVAVARTGYDAFGAVTASGGAVAQPFGFTGREFDADSGLMQYRQRYYEPAFGTFARSDPLRSLEGRNRYAFVLGQPTKLVDPTGMVSTDFSELPCVVGLDNYPRAVLAYIKGLQFAYYATIEHLGDDEAQYFLDDAYGYFVEGPDLGPKVRFDHSDGRYYATTAVKMMGDSAGPITIYSLTIYRSYSDPVFMARTLVHEMAHYVRWNRPGHPRTDPVDWGPILNSNLEEEWKTLGSDTTYEGYRAEQIVFGSVRDHH